MRRWELDDFSEEGGATGVESEGHVTGAVNWQKAMNALEMGEWRKVRRKKKCMLDGMTNTWLGPGWFIREKARAARSKSTDVDLTLKGFGSSKRCTTHPLQRQRESGYV